MANPDILSMNGGSTFIYFCSLCSFGENGIDLLQKLKQQSHEFIMPSNSNMFLIPKTKSTFSWISDINVFILNLYPCISTIIDIMNKTLTNCPFLT